MTWREWAASLDWVLLGASLLIVLMGLGMLISSAPSSGLTSGLALRQAVALLVSVAVMVGVARIPYHVWQRWAPWLYGIGLVGLLVVTTTGELIRGTVSRLELFGWQLQPSEFMKVALVLVLAWLLVRYRTIGWRAVTLSTLLLALPTGLVLVEPDAGMAALLIATWGGLLLFAGLPWRYVAVLGLLGILLGGGAWQWLLLDYQKDRLRTFFQPGADPLAAGYNITQSMIAFGSGGVFGRGLGHGPQSQLKFLPERHTDFVLASLGEELGFIGVTILIALYATLLSRILRIAKSTQDKFGQLLAVGICIVMLASFTVSAGMNIGLLPVTGIPLPLLSYGGSNLLATFFLLGLAQSIRAYSRFVQTAPHEISGLS
ncbi:MAG: rod shape-determining protein RodA [Candidatus Andersenbacteria bacterium]|nr:rod shape-determining protein RodA [Candidatus Andersenbacteria bacterium]MBI3250511.1 rod shape-determining protein RodA [Candidatus Andersenbacteria bacterium]